MPDAIIREDSHEAWASFESENPVSLTLRLLTPDEALTAATPFASLIRVWLDRRSDAAPPDWSTFDFADFRGWHSRLMTTVFPDDQPDPEFRIVGDAWRNMSGGNIRGRRFSQCTPRLYATQYHMHFRAIRDTGLVGWSYGRPTIAGREHVRIQIIELPIRHGSPAIGGLIHGLFIGSSDTPA